MLAPLIAEAALRRDKKGREPLSLAENKSITHQTSRSEHFSGVFFRNDTNALADARATDCHLSRLSLFSRFLFIPHLRTRP